jgi:sugar O-acyltransferase (sialic acid O-acetyltransferase NeuD family)
MLIAGAGGFAKELIEIFHQKNETAGLAFYDDINEDVPQFLFNRFQVLRNQLQAKDFFDKHDPLFTIGIGNPGLRYDLYKKFVDIGGVFTSVISPLASISSFDVTIGAGCNILAGAAFSNCTTAGIGCIIYYNAVITHDARLGNFVQVSPGVSILGGGSIGDFTLIGANAIILPNISIGKYAVIGAGSVVTRPVPDYALMKGNPSVQTGWVSKYGCKLNFNNECVASCDISHQKYSLLNNTAVELKE